MVKNALLAAASARLPSRTIQAQEKRYSTRRILMSLMQKQGTEEEIATLRLCLRFENFFRESRGRILDGRYGTAQSSPTHTQSAI